ncbi:MAG: hypothetical protein KAI79_06805, partial [Bacteroidales bacterium]|nr:hypothetical protein [Bacteroidales bacterium]
MKDALGNDVVLGKMYGHSTRTSGFVTVVLGEATNISDTGVEITIVNRGQGLYKEPIHEAKIGRKIVTLLGNSIFPIQDKIQWAQDE